MKITERLDMDVQFSGLRRTESAQKGASRVSAGNQQGSQKTDSANINVLDQLQNLASALETPDRSALIDQLRSAVQSGGYQVDPQALSDAVITSMLHRY